MAATVVVADASSLSISDFMFLNAAGPEGDGRHHLGDMVKCPYLRPLKEKDIRLEYG